MPAQVGIDDVHVAEFAVDGGMRLLSGSSNHMIRAGASMPRAICRAAARSSARLASIANGTASGSAVSTR